MEQEKEVKSYCGICADETFPIDCDCDDHLDYCPACMSIFELLDFHAYGLSDSSVRFWNGLANYAFKQRDIAMKMDHIDDETTK